MGGGSYMLPHHYNYQQYYNSQQNPHAASDIAAGSGGMRRQTYVKYTEAFGRSQKYWCDKFNFCFSCAGWSRGKFC